jgi:outer membrane lipoprotein-sorting protein
MTRRAPVSAHTTRPMSRWAAALSTGLALAVASTCAHAAWDMQQLMESLAQAKSGRATFVETKHIAMLDKPVESSGELLFVAPDRLEKRTLKPKPESMVVDGDELSIERGNRNYHLRLQSYPELAAFIDSIRGTLAGNRKTLERDFRLNLSGTAGAWTLQLFPFDEKMKAVVRRVVITGAQGQVNNIQIDQADGDSSVMVIEKSTAR